MTSTETTPNGSPDVDADAIVAAFYDAFEADPDVRLKRIAATFAPDIAFSDPMHQFVGHEGLAKMADGLDERFPGARFNRPTNIQSHHRQIHFCWSMDDADGNRIVTGHDLLLVGGDGRITHDYSFFGDPSTTA